MAYQARKTLSMNKFYVVHDINDLEINKKSRRINKKRSISLNCCGFDIETTNIIQRDEKGQIQSAKAVMYHWQFCINNTVYLGRTWDEMKKFFTWLDKKVKSKLIIWVANLGFEMSFLMGHFSIKKCFAKTPWSPLYFTIFQHLEFHDCLQVTGGNLAFLAKNYCSPENQKLKGDLDFTKMRHYATPLAEKEIKYCINDVTILSEYAQYIFDTFHDVPITKTGILRKEVKKKFELLDKDVQTYIKRLIPDKTEYCTDMKYLFQGGFTHANFLCMNQKFPNVVGLDLASSYPAVMLQEYYPMTPFREVELDTDGRYITDARMKTHCVKFCAMITGIKATYCHTILSEHKLKKDKVQYEDGTIHDIPENAVYDNGRLLSADAVIVYLTELDYDILKKFYTWKNIEVRDAKISDRAPLPDYLTSCIRYYYQKKYELKRDGKKDTLDYLLSKQAVNSFYGMTVTKLVLTDLLFNDDKKFFELDKMNEKPWYRVTKNEFLSPYWGVWVTSHARHRILSVIYDITLNSDGFSDAIYSDTDSIYVRHYEKHKPLIEKFNIEIKKKNMCLGDAFQTLGTFELDGDYEFFKTLGSKRYMTEKKGHISATIAGVDGDVYCRNIPQGEDPFSYFDMKKTLYLDMNVSEKKGHHYFYTPDCYVDIDDGTSVQKMECFSGCAIYDIPFEMKSVSKIWMQMLMRTMTDRGII